MLQPYCRFLVLMLSEVDSVVHQTGSLNQGSKQPEKERIHHENAMDNNRTGLWASCTEI